MTANNSTKTELQWFRGAEERITSLKALKKGNKYNIHIRLYTTTKKQKGFCTVKAEYSGSLNKKKQYKFKTSTEEFILNYIDLYSDTVSTEVIMSKLKPWYVTEAK